MHVEISALSLVIRIKSIFACIMSARYWSWPTRIRSQKIQSHTIAIEGGRRRALWTETALEFGCVRDHDQVRSSWCGQLCTNLLAHVGFKRIVPCCFRNKRMRLKTRAYGTKDTVLEEDVLIDTNQEAFGYAGHAVNNHVVFLENQLSCLASCSVKLYFKFPSGRSVQTVFRFVI